MKSLGRLGVCCLLVLFLQPLAVKSQQNFSSETELKTEALRLFDLGRYEDAAPLYSSLLSLYPTSPEYNFRYGACLVFSDSDREKPLKYLLFADKQSSEFPEIKYFLGKAYHNNYRFAEAETAYQAFLSTASSKLKSRYPSERELQMVRDGKELIRTFNDLTVMDKKLVNRSDFFRSYDLGAFGGKIIVKPEEFQTSLDRKSGEQFLIFLADDADRLFYSSYGDNTKTGKDIYYVDRLATGGWSKPIPLGFPVNTPYDEDYPFLHPNGNILYFSSRGHNSMGGYDVFKSEYNIQSKTWSMPVNLEFPLNSTSDELLFITNESDEIACFASSRASHGGKIHVFKISNEMERGVTAMIKGEFIRPEGSKGDLNAKITIIGATSNRNLGTFRPHPTSGDYLLNLPGGGSYKFLVEVPGYPPQTGQVEIPAGMEGKALKQEMELVNHNGVTRLRIKNLFDEEVSELELALLRELMAKDRSQLAVNTSTETVPKSEVKSDTEPALSHNENVRTEPLSNQEILSMAQEGVEDLKIESERIQMEAEYAFSFAGSRTEKARRQKAEAEQMKIQAEGLNDPAKKKEQTDAALKLEAESEQTAREAMVAYNMALKLEEDAEKKSKEAAASEQYAIQLEQAVNTKNDAEALRLLEAQKAMLQSSATTPSGSEGVVSALREKAETRRKQAAQYVKKSESLSEELSSLQEEITAVRSEASQTKDQSLQDELLARAATMDEEHKAISEQRQNLIASANNLRRESEQMESDIELVEQVIQQQQNGTEQISLTNEEKQELAEDVRNVSASLDQSESDNRTNNESGEVNPQPISGGSLTATEPKSDAATATEEEKTISTENEREISGIVNPSDKTAESNESAGLSQAREEVLMLQDSADFYRAQALNASSPDERTALFERAANADRRVWEKRTKVFEEQSRMNQTLFLSNEGSLNSAASGNQSNGDQAEVANLLRSEAQEYFGQSRNLMQEAEAQENPLDQISTMERAARFEELALARQQSAYKILSGGDELPTAAEPSGTASLTNREPVSTEVEEPVESTNAGEAVVTENPNPFVDPASVENPPAASSNGVAGPIYRARANIAREEADLLADEVEDLRLHRDSLVSIRDALPRKKQGAYSYLVQNAEEELALKEEEAAKRAQLAAAWESRMSQPSEGFVPGNSSEIMQLPEYLVFSELHQESSALDEEIANQETLAASFERDAANTESAMRRMRSENPEIVSSVEYLQMQSTMNEQLAASDSMKRVVSGTRDSSDALKVELRNYLAALDLALSSGILSAAENDQTLNSDLTAALRSNDVAGEAITTDVVSVVSEPVEAIPGPENQDPPTESQVIPNTEEIPFQTEPEPDSVVENVIIESPNTTEEPQPALTIEDTNAPDVDVVEEPITTSLPVRAVEETVSPSVTTTGNYSVPKVLDREIFERTRGAVYSRENPIPIGVEMPQGLVFKVQVGAFRNPIPQDHFAGFAPLTGERTASGLTRYTAGFFRTYGPALSARDDIRSNGYRDAFVVAYLNGRRISYQEAMAIVNGNQGEVQPETSGLAGRETPGSGVQPGTTNTFTDSRGTSSSQLGGSVENQPLPAEGEMVASAPLESTRGVVFTVQVGVYSRPVTGGQLSYLQPLYTENTSNGYIRYTAGAYSNTDLALRAKSIINNGGISDAFISAYIDGRKVSIAEARSALEAGANVIPSPTLDQMPSFGNDQGNNLNPDVVVNPGKTGVDQVVQVQRETQTEVNPSSSLNVPDSEDGNQIEGNVVYKVQVGAFRDEVPNDMAVKYIKVSSKGIEHYMNEEQMTIYSVGNFSRYEDAARLRDELASQFELPDSFITAYQNGVKIDINKALELSPKADDN